MHVLPRQHLLAPDLRDRAIALHLLDRHDRIAAARQHGAGHDFDAGVGIRQSLRWIARGLHAGDAQATGVVDRGRGGERDAIHGHPVERRMIAFGVDVFTQDGARCLGQRQGFDRQARQVLLDQSFGLGRRQHGHGFL